MNQKLTRRVFLQGAAACCAALAASALGGCAREIPVAYVLPDGERTSGGGVFQTQTLRVDGRTCTLRVTDCAVDNQRNMIAVSLTVVNNLEFALCFNNRGTAATEKGQLSLTARTDGVPSGVTVLSSMDGGLAASYDNLSGRSIDAGTSAQGKLYLRADNPEWGALTLAVQMNDGAGLKQAVFCLSR